MALAALAALAGCAKNLTTDTRSSAFATTDEKLAFLRRYVELRTPVERAEFHIDYQDNSGGCLGPAGPSDWDSVIALKIAPADVAAWTKDLALERDAESLDWMKDVPLDGAAWARSSAARVYHVRLHDRLVVFAPEGILYLFTSTTGRSAQ